MPPGWTSTNAAAIVFDTGNTLLSAIRTVPLLVLIGCCAVNCYNCKSFFTLIQDQDECPTIVLGSQFKSHEPSRGKT